jgi:serine/threonine-protein kinase
MEWVDGDSLAKLYNAVIRAQRRFPLPLIVRIAADACAGLHAAHELHDSDGRPLVVVHRDVSPQNILVSVGGSSKIIDFGVAKAAQRMTQETSAGLVKGKIQYASPEQATGRAVDRRSDIWAMGTVVYQLITGRLPYDGENQLATLHMLTSGKPPRPLPPTVPKGLQEVVRRALSFRPEDRFATAHEMERALEASVTPLGTHGEVATLVQELLGDRSDARKRDVQGALAALSSRARIAMPALESSPRVPTGPGLATPASASGVNVRPPTPSTAKKTLMGMAPPPPAPPPRTSSPSFPGLPAPPPPAFAPAPPPSAAFAPPAAPEPAPPAPLWHPAPPATSPASVSLGAAAAAPASPIVAPVPSPATHSPSGRPLPTVIVAADAAPASPMPAQRPRELRAIHMVLGGSALIVTLGVWAAVAIVLMHAPPASASAAVIQTDGAPKKDSATSAPTTASAVQSAPPAATTASVAAPQVPAPPATASAAPPPVVAAAPAIAPTPATVATSPTPPKAIAAAPASPAPPSTTPAPPATGKAKKKRKIDDGF